MCTEKDRPLKLYQTNLAQVEEIGLKLHRHKKFKDQRGALKVLFESPVIEVGSSEISLKKSFSEAGVGRGLHAQSAPYEQTKYITVTEGKIIDFILDLENSPLIIYCFELNSTDDTTIEIPGNFAHGFITLAPTSFEYLCVGQYSEKNEQIFNVLDSAAQLLGYGDLILSSKDKLSTPIQLSFDM